MRVLGLDIGGANLKAADASGHAVSRPFAIWKYPDRLADELRLLISPLSEADVFAVTMTAELADCFATKAEGVSRILAAVTEVAGTRPVWVWLTSGEFVSPADARKVPLAAAASNWHAQATWAGRHVPDRTAILIDIGTTTTDLIPLEHGYPVARGNTDLTRMLAGELVYTGVRRTPLCALAGTVPLLGTACPLAAELFATTLDLYLRLGEIAEDATDTETANGQPATLAAAHDRLARQFCCDRQELDETVIDQIARHLADRHLEQILAALKQVLSDLAWPAAAVVSGSGSWLARRVLQQDPHLKHLRIIDLQAELGTELATAACAYAVAVLAAEKSLAP